jgi:predicted enzyme related to lactoylglutathione lyase
MPHPVLQFQILSADPDATARFYSDLFEWTIDSNNPLGYRQIRTGSDQGIQGGIWPAPEQSPNFVQLFVATSDVQATAKKAESLGARLLIPPTVLPEGDEMAVLKDPKGMPFGIWRARQQ